MATMDGTSYANVKATVEALTGNLADGQWSLSWAPKSLQFNELALTIRGPDDEGDVRAVTSVYDIPASILERVVSSPAGVRGMENRERLRLRASL
jgi:hypothetical protein